MTPQGGVATVVINEIRANAPEEQSITLADGEVTLLELNQAIDAYATCGEQAGYVSVDIAPAKGLRPRHIVFEIATADPNNVVATADAVARKCQATYLDSVSKLWGLQMPVPTKDQVSELYDWLESCLGNGSVLDDASSGSFTTYPTAPKDRSLTIPADQHVRYSHCAAEAEAIFGLKSPSPMRRPTR